MLKDSELAEIKKAAQEDNEIHAGLLYEFDSAEVLALLARLESAEKTLRDVLDELGPDRIGSGEPRCLQWIRTHFSQTKG